MSAITEPLILDLVEWVAQTPRSYREVMDAWRTSCPRLTVWEEAAEQGLVVREHVRGAGTIVRVSPAGIAHLERAGRRPRAAAAPRAA